MAFEGAYIKNVRTMGGEVGQMRTQHNGSVREIA